MALLPENQKLWNTILRRMEGRYPSKSANGKPNIQAVKAASKEYKRLGGQYVSGKSQVPKNMRDPQTDAQKKKQARIRADKKRNII